MLNRKITILLLVLILSSMTFTWNACRKEHAPDETARLTNDTAKLTTDKEKTLAANLETPAPGTITSRVLTTGLRFPWEIMWGAKGQLWITERNDGLISSINLTTGLKTPILKISEVVATREGGLMGMVRHPNFFQDQPYIYVAYNYGIKQEGLYKLKVVRYRWTGTELTEPLTIIDNIDGGITNHNGGRLAFEVDKTRTRDHKLLITIGDSGNGQKAPNMSSLNGKILRLNPDGTIPADNPFPGSPIWSLGHRNPQGLVWVNGKVYSSEHGTGHADEINIITKGRNYGWPGVEGKCDLIEEQSYCNENNVVEPIQEWTPTIAPSGMEYYDSDVIPQWKGSLLLAGLKSNSLFQLKLSDDGNQIIGVTKFFHGMYGRLRDVVVAPNGKVYIITSKGFDDKVIEVSLAQ